MRSGAIAAPAQRATSSSNADWVRALQRTASIARDSTRTLARIVDEQAATTPTHPALIGLDSVLDYRALADMSLRIASWAAARGLRRGDRVALMMGNAPAYPAIWLGLGRLGIITALINTNLTGPALAHCIGESAASVAIADAVHAASLRATGTETWVFGPTTDALDQPHLDLEAHPPADADDLPPVTLAEPALLVYTSGTTGLPKAAFVSHHRISMWSEWFAGISDAKPVDRLYDCLPLYHSVGGVVAVGAMLAAGGSVIVRPSFSARRFWADVAASEATIFQYIGELCRYLVAATPGADDGAHKLRLAIGNGLRADVWQAFVDRFAVPRVIEFYAATEGSFSLFNLDGRAGAIGRFPGFMAHRSPVALVRSDPATGEPVRDPTGFCVPCVTGEPGEALGRLATDATGLSGRFEGYTRPEATDRKILRDVFATGDRWFRTGDLMRRDREGFFFFVDRIGDTFRWKGENVSTAEVADVIGQAPGVLDVAVYGVTIPGADGRAGMAALVVEDGFDHGVFHAHVAAHLPRYARPLLLRLRDRLDITGTFRQQKSELASDGYDPDRVTDPMLLDRGEAYQPLDRALAGELTAGRVRL